MNLEDFTIRLKEKGLKVTPQRLAVLDALVENNTHPNAESIIKKIRRKHPSISVGTIYNILDVFVEKGIIAKLRTEDNIMRYDPLVKEHHHIYVKDKGDIIDYFDDELTELVKKYLSNKNEFSKIEIESIKINISGNKIYK